MAHRGLVVGAGNAGKAHAEALAGLGIDHVGPVSGIETASDPVVMRDASIDVVHIATTNDLHAPLITAALREGKHVVCEKPLTSEVRDAEEVAAAARIRGVHTTICQNYRFMPLVAELRARIASGELGEVHLVRGSFLQDWLLLVSDEDWRIDPARGGGSRTVADIGVHWIDLAESLTGRTVEAVAAQLGYLHARKTEDHASLLIRFTGGLQGACVVSQAAAGHRNRLEISVDGTKASATWRGDKRNELWLGMRDAAPVTVDRRGARAPVARTLAGLSDIPDEGRRNLVAAFYAALDGTPSPVPLPTFDDGLRHVRFAAAALASARTGGWVEVA